MFELYPLVCRPLFHAKVWGGQRLARLYGKPLPEGENIGESWEVADLKEGASSVANGRYEGRTLTDLVALGGRPLVGTAWPAGRFPLLVKLLDASSDLSVQVHPSDDDCRQYFPDAHSKDESWVVLDAEPGSSVYFGCRDGVTSEQFNAALNTEGVVDLLAKVEVHVGDVLHCTPGTVHALGAGVAVAEVQEPSDTTFRIYDFGRGREVHIEQAKRCVRVDAPHAAETPIATTKSWGMHELLVDCPAYRMERLTADDAVTWNVDPRSVQVVVLLGGAALIQYEGGTLTAKAGDTLLLPALIGEVTFAPLGRLVALTAGAGGVTMID